MTDHTENLTDLQKIVHVPRRFTPDKWGGTESVIYHLCCQQQKSGWQPEIHTSQALNPVSHEIWRTIPIHRYRYCYPFFGLTAEEKHALDLRGGNLLSLSLFWRLYRMPHIRLYHAHVAKRMGGEVLTAARLRGLPCVVTLHGNFFDVPPAEARDRIAAQSGHFEWGKPFGMLFGSRHLLEQADAVLCVGFSEYEKAKQQISHNRVYHLPNGVEPATFQSGDRQRGRQRLKLSEDQFLFGCISRIDPQKDQLTLVRAFASIEKTFPQARLLLAGPVTDLAYEKEIHQAIENANIRDKVILLEALEPESEEHLDTLAALDTFVLPSRHEPFGIVVLEAWAASKPVIAAHIGGLQRLITSEKTGLHFESGSPESLAQQMGSIIRNRDFAQDLARCGAREVEGSYSWKKIASDLEQIYQFAEERHPKK